MKIGVLGKIDKIGAEETIAEIQQFLIDLGYEAVRFSAPSEIDDVDAVLVLGGDGSILHAAVPAAQKGVKLIGINYGTLGFLTEYEKDERKHVRELLALLENGQCKIVKRSILEVTVDNEKFYALNEVAIQRDNSPYQGSATQILTVDITAKEGCESIAGDGVLICTPTGSTAYSLSAGGAILTPEVPVVMMTPICAFSMRVRPIVFSDTDEFTLKIKKGKAMVLVDGQAVSALTECEHVQVKKAPFTADFPVKKDSDFFARVRNKLNA